VLLTIGYLGIVQNWNILASHVVTPMLALPAGAVLAADAVADIQPGGVTPECREAVMKRLLAIIPDDAHVEAPLRCAAGNVLARLGDPRPGVGRVKETGLPDIDWKSIPPGSVTMGEDDEVCTVTLGYSYQLSKYPITVAQFESFITAGGYEDKRWWTPAGWRWRERNEIAGPGKYGLPFDVATHPVAGVSWYEAQAFANWLTQVYRECGVIDAASWIALPSEAEWERGARGGDARRYPWGSDWDANRANCREAGIGATSAVGCFPGGRSPYGIEEMSGNVWEWTRSKYVKYPYKADMRESSEGDEARVLRGGSWRADYPGLFRAAVRCWVVSWYRGGGIGFRCVVRSPGP
jgi:formylglycine-generating enzyme required for sulfatase activity